MLETAQWILDTLLSVIPRMGVMPATEGGIAFVRGTPHVIKPGSLYFYWPVWTQVIHGPICQQTLDLRPQVVMSKDGVSVMVSGSLVYEIQDIMASYGSLHDVDKAIQDIALSGVMDILHGNTMKDVVQNLPDYSHDLELMLRRKLKKYGVYVLTAFISDLSKCQVIRIVGDGATHFGVIPGSTT